RNEDVNSTVHGGSWKNRFHLLGDIGEIGFHRPIQQHLRIGQWLIIDQPIQLATPSHGRAILNLYSIAVNDQGTFIIEQ
ncbi:MAG: hypothetical protein IJ343_01935, partial [Clostridia bacterium]|nr:hypothetical protein [Clostridia bacterium]